MRRLQLLLIGTAIMSALLSPAARAAQHLGVPNRSDELSPMPYEEPFAQGADYDPELPTPEGVLGHLTGSYPATPAEIRTCFEALAAASSRIRLENIGRSHEGNPLFYAILSEPRTLNRLDEIEDGIAALAAPADARSVPSIERLVETQPVVIWIGGAVHGDEPSGADAALALLYHLAADRSQETQQVLENAIILIDPLQNPDGRMRLLARLDQWSSRIPNLDHQSVQHRSGWPAARGNHYLIDLNRDWFALSQIETRARVGVLLRWRPQVTIDLHEMGSFDTYLFSPPRPPHNQFLPSATPKWWERFSQKQARAFGEMGWSCYTGDWNEELNPNRGAAWPLFLGSVAILEEQAGTEGAAIKHPDGSIRSYREAVHHHFIATLAVVEEAAAGRAELLRDYVRSRRESISLSEGGAQAYLISTTENPDAARRLVHTLSAQGLEVRRTLSSFRLPEARDYWGETRGNQPFGAGSYIVPLDQPDGRLARAILDFDPQIAPEILDSERHLREANQPSLFYEATAWSLAMAHGAEVYESDEPVRVRSEPVSVEDPEEGIVVNPTATYGFLLNAKDEGAVVAAAALLSSGLNVWAVGEPFRTEGHEFGTGSMLLRRAENGPHLVAVLEAIAARTGAWFFGVDHPLSEMGPDLGSRRFRYLKTPRAALLVGSPFYQSTTGALWCYMDQELHLGCTLLSVGSLASSDLDKYNVIIVPDAAPGKGPEVLTALGPEGVRALDDWIIRGGTLIALGEGTWALTGREEPLGTLRARRQVLDEIDSYERAASREAWAAGLVDGACWPDAPRESEDVRPYTREVEGAAVEAVTSEGDEWLRRFRPEGAILRANLNCCHWLSAGVGSRVPVIVKTDLALMGKQPVEIVGRFAVEEKLRVSGLLWPEARERWAKTSYLSRESIGKGQVIAFLGNPIYRGYFHGTGRLLANALLLGPGMGTPVRTEW